MQEQPAQESSDASTQGLLKPPQDYKMVWRDESARPESALCFWRPIPWPGYGT